VLATNTSNFTAADLAALRSSLSQGYDPILDECIIPQIPKPYRKRSTEYKPSRRQAKGHKENRRAQYFKSQIRKSSDRGSLVILRFLREDGYAEFRIQRDVSDNLNEQGTGYRLKGKPGFIFGSPDNHKEPDESVGLRETEEEALVPADVGKIVKVSDINAGNRYYVAVFVKTVPFDTEDGKGEDVYEYDRCTKEEVEDLVRERGLLHNHIVGWNMAVAGGFV